MSEEILKALTQLFAIITKQDGGVTEKERMFVIRFFQQELDQDSVKEYLELYDKYVGYNQEEDEEEEKQKKVRKLTSVRDSVKTLAICKKINKTLTQKQKVVVLIKILELVASDKNFTPQRMEIVDTISTVFKFSKDEYKLIESFVLSEGSRSLNFEDMLVVNSGIESLLAETGITTAEQPEEDRKKYVHTDLEGELIFMQVKSVDMYFVRYLGHEEVVLNGFIMKPEQVYLYSHGSTIKTPKGAALYYSDLTSQFNLEAVQTKLSFNAIEIGFRFANGDKGLRNINISEGPGNLIGIMGASGAGKTTLLNVLAGIESPSEGEILINGYNLHTEKDQLQGVIGYVSQDDLLIEELTVYQNLYYNAKLCFAGMPAEELHQRVLDMLESLGLEQRKDLKVGSVLDKTISGGQRKRLNIALELIREPAILFVDEPTSGLSSRDSENVIDLLKELSLKGKLIFVVIHQPSSDIYKMFDKMYIMDTGGYPIFYGNPVEAVTYFKKATNQVDSDRGQCPTCSNVNPEQIFNIIEAKVVDEYGQLTNKRKVNPMQWHDQFKEKFRLEKVEDIKELPPKNLSLPSRLKQTAIFTLRDTLSKLGNKQYLLINLLEAPLLALILSFIIRYHTRQEYTFRFNENIPAFLMMAIVVALFMGLSVSAEEIIRDRKILKRESFLNLSWNSYLTSKLLILFTLSAIQTFCFVLIGNLVLDIKGMTMAFWLVLFSVSCFANVLGLNVSSAFNSAVTVYILIPMLLIPQMILSGLLFPFDKLNNTISKRGEVPLVADMMASRWAYEAMAIYQFKNNLYNMPAYYFEQKARTADFKSNYLMDKLGETLTFIRTNQESADDSVQLLVQQKVALLRNELAKEPYKEGLENIRVAELKPADFTEELAGQLELYFENLRSHYLESYQLAETKLEELPVLRASMEPGFDINTYKNLYFNESLSDLVRNVSTEDRIIESNGEFIPLIDPVYQIPDNPAHALDYRSHFFAPQKHLFGRYFDTYIFNIVVIWLMTALLYCTLYVEALRKFLNLFSK
ncbi:ATP-binding cassette domain-containing protein [Nafulsella turpanensis]|uniref:ATP-binding cassette domain-containing protein n=1 Tax=Nafulsella turpanensis TaxID=1265690 RepID=UPI0003492F5B|nr:ATP-binding cassette domain-containing protein [Nafulsella turpanensis]